MSEGLAAPAEAALDGSREDLPPVPREGVSLAALRAFADEHRGRSFAVPDEAHSGEKVSRSFEELTTAQVCELIIKPLPYLARTALAARAPTRSSCARRCAL